MVASSQTSNYFIDDKPKPRSLLPQEGLLTLVLMSVAVGLVGMTVANGRLADRQTLFVAMAVAGFLFGFLLAKTRASDIFAHALAFLIGIPLALFAVDTSSSVAAFRAREWHVLLDQAEARLDVLVASFRNGSSLNEEVAALSIATVIWLVGYSSAWMLFRRGWYSGAVLLPGSIMLFGLAINRDAPVWPLFAFVSIAIALLARHDAFERSRVWQQRGMANPARYAARSAVAGACVGILALVAGLAAPLSVPDDALAWTAARSEQLQSFLAEQTDRFSDTGIAPPGAGAYTSFDNAFDIGAGTPHGDAPLVLVKSDARSYLAARKFDSYTGTGWDSTFQEALAKAEELPAPPLVAFAPNQSMSQPTPLQDNSESVVGIISILEPMGGLLLTLESHYQASVATTARVGWQYVNQVYIVDEVDLASLPVDLQAMVSMLKGTPFTIDEEGAVQFSDLLIARQIESIQANLFDKYPLRTDITIDDVGRLIVSVEGRVPIYDDVEAVYFAERNQSDQAYRTIGVRPPLSRDQLSRASEDYPALIAERYLGQTDMVTERTGDLAHQIVSEAGASDPYSMAMAIQNYLRGSYGYIIDSDRPPAGQDAVDYFLFDRQMGRCDHFSSAMVMMLRSLAVPSRIVTGFAPVEFDVAANGYVYRGRDAHSWVEVYFPDIGWVPFEPTPSESPIGETTETTLDAIETPTPTPEPTVAAEEPVEEPSGPTATPAPIPPATIDQQPDGGGGSDGLPTALLLAGALLALAFGTLGLLWNWRLRGLSPEAAYFLRLTRAARFWGIRPDPTRTPAELASLFGRAAPASEGAARQIADAYVMERYGASIDDGRGVSIIRRSWSQIRRSAMAWRPWRRSA
jgi:transglutaminase-like putative cysteine protease